MTRLYHLNPDHSVTEVGDASDPKAVAKWADFWDRNRRVAVDVLGEDIEVSTVFLGVDHNFWGKGPPVLFETMIFGPYGGGDQWRYSTWDEAVDGHKRVVAELAARVAALGESSDA